MSARAEKRRRHRAILDVLRRQHIASQDQLVAALAAEEHHVTQSTLSRDLRDLRVLRVPSEHGYRYLPAGEGPPGIASAAMRTVAAAEIASVVANESLVVVRTQVGRASGVAAFLDSLRLDGVLATLAGDDTILVVPSHAARTAAVKSRLDEVFGRR